MTLALVAVGWGLVGAAGGWFVRWGSVRLARLEELEPGNRSWQVYGPLILAALLFAAFAYHMGAVPLLLLRSVFVLVLVQVIFFDFEHRLILDRVMFPAMALALLASLFSSTRLIFEWQDPPWWAGIATGIGAGVLFLLLAVGGSLLFKADAMGFGDVKLVMFLGFLLGPLATAYALFYGVLLAALASIGVIIRNRSVKGTLAYGPYLAAGALIMLFKGT